MKKLFTTFLLAAFALLTGCSQIDSGNVGVTKFGGKTNETELAQGWHVTWFATVDEFTTKEVSFPYNDMHPKTQDNITMEDVDVDLYVRANPSKVAETTIKYVGDVVKHKEIDPANTKGTSDLFAGYNRVNREAREAVYKAATNFASDTVHLKREEFAAELIKTLQKELDKDDPGVWTVVGANVRSLVASRQLEKSALEKAQVDEQLKKKAKEIELAKAEAQRAFVVADGQAKVNERLAQSLTPQMLQLRLAELQTGALIAAAQKGATVINGVQPTPVLPIK